MNASYEHHQHSIRFACACFDRLLLNATVQPFVQPERAVGFFSQCRQIFPVTRQVLRNISEEYASLREQNSRLATYNVAKAYPTRTPPADRSRWGML